MPNVLTVLYNIECWWLNEDVKFWNDPAALRKTGEKTLKTFMLPGRFMVRTGAGEDKTRTPGVRGCLCRTLVESIAVSFGIDFHFEEA